MYTAFRKILLLLVCCTAYFNIISVSAFARGGMHHGFPDSPHNTTNSILCTSCHDFASPDPKFIPVDPDEGSNIDDTRYNSLCVSCHNPGYGAPVVKTHSSLNTSDRYGDWTVECWVCHNEHRQEAIALYPDALLYSGTTDDVTETTITDNEANWPVDGLIGMRVVPNTEDETLRHWNYKIVSNTATVLEVEGTIDIEEIITPEHIEAGHGYGIYLGKLMPEYIDLGWITAPGEPKSGRVFPKLFRHEGANSFADGDTVYDGICEVCHTMTRHFQNDGTSVDQNHSNLSEQPVAGTNCIRCHSHTNGFVHGRGPGSGCEECHGHDPGYEYQAGFFSLGAGTFQSHSTHTEDDDDDLKGPSIACADCHDTDNFPYFKSGSDGDGDTMYSLAETDVCDNCHSPGGAFDGVNGPGIGAAANWDAGIYEEDGITLPTGKETWCASCHDQDSAGTAGVSLEDFEAYTDDLDLEATWENVQDARPVYLEATGGPDGSQCMRVRVNWTRSADDYATARRSLALDLSNAGAIRFQVKVSDTARITQIAVQLRKDPEGTICEATMSTSGLQNNVWEEVSFPRASFNNPTWGKIDLIRLRMFEVSPASSWVEDVYFDDITAPPLVGPNVVRDNVTSGFYVSGHGTYFNCTWCHDPSRSHIDGQQRSVYDYIKSQANPTGFRFYGNADMGLQLPYTSYQAGPTGAFALCYQCHPEANITQDEPAEQLTTNFTDTGVLFVGPENLHLSHVGGPGSPLTPSVYHGTCVLCHNVHGEANPAMTRRDMGNLIYFDANGCEIERGADSNGNGIDDWRDPAINLGGAQTEGTATYSVMCVVCHNTGVPPNPDCAGSNPYLGSSNFDGWYNRAYEEVAISPPSRSHLTHLTDLKGPQLGEHGCEVCHSVSPLENACVTCHSPGGSFDGMYNDANGSVGAWTNWAAGVYEEDGETLQAGKEKWCAGCHDEEPGNSEADGSGILAPNVIGDEDGGYAYGAGWGYYKNGHGLATGFYPASGAPAANQPCSGCHDFAASHIDGTHRTYLAASDNYQSGYRLISIGGQPPMDIPRTDNNMPASDFALCLSCHNSGIYLTSSDFTTNFRDADTNAHYYHLQGAPALANRWDSDWDGGTGDSMVSCPACHNVHGSSSPRMVRHGELISTPGTTDKVPALEFKYQPAASYPTLMNSTGGTTRFYGSGAGSIAKNGICGMCHNDSYPYTRTPTDMYPPEITGVYGKVGSAVLTVTFSEGLYTDAGASGGLSAGDFTYNDADDSRTVSGVTHAAGDNFAILTLSAPLDATDDIGVDTLVAASAASIYDAASQAMDTTPVTVTGDGAAPVLANQSPASGATDIAVNSNLTFTLADSGAGVDWSSFQIQLTGDNGYAKTYTDLDTAVVFKTGDMFSSTVTVNPDLNFSNNEIITLMVHVSDYVGNALTPPAWSFTTQVVSTPQTMTIHPSGLAAEGNGNFAPTGGAWDDVLDSNDGDVTYVSVCCQGFGTSYVDMDDPDISGATINSVTVKAVVRNDPGPYNVNIGYKTGTAVIWKGNTSVGNTYTTLTMDAPTDSDGGAWSLTDLNNLRVAVLRNYTGTPRCYVTEVAVEINYTL